MFREYDIRGRESAEELSEDSIYHIARGFAAFLKKHGVEKTILGHDSRGTSERFHAAAARGLIESGISVIDIGTVTTPMSYFAGFHFDIDGLFMITASHNPVGWNGAKLGYSKGTTLLPDEVKELYSIIEKEAYANGAGTLEKRDVREPYLSELVGKTKLARPLSILLNTGNGTAGLFAPELLQRIGCTVVEHLTNVDPTYPNYTPNPDGTAMMLDTGEMTVKHACNIGIAFDGDGDRLGVTDETGAVIWPDRYLILLSRGVLRRHPGASIIFDVKVSEALPEDIKAHGGVPVMWKTGHSYIKSKRAELNAPLAGEMSGHIFFGDDYYGFDDAFFACLRLLEYVAKEQEPLSKLIADTPYYVSTPTIQVKVTDEVKYSIVDALTKEFTDEGYRLVTVNGARVYTEDGWGLVRASSNTPSLVLRFESKTPEGLERLRLLFANKLASHGIPKSAWDETGH
jgi:phosphomannomutase/phosphoglucomutase